jgi:hypothetical protein
MGARDEPTGRYTVRQTQEIVRVQIDIDDDEDNEDRCARSDYSFHLEINEVASDYLSYRLDYGEGITSGALSLERLLDSVRDTMKRVIQNSRQEEPHPGN